MATRPLIRIPQMRPSNGHKPRLAGIEALADFVREQSPLLVVTGAGLSTRSGIPAYRDGDGRWLRRDPILFQDFMRSDIVRRRYWARSYFGWQLMRQAEPNPAHQALAAMEQGGRLALLVTQNVDGLHAKAGSLKLVELHGRLDRVRCLDCGQEVAREIVQRRLEALNPEWHPTVLGYNPDGDAELDADAYPGFQVASCELCTGSLKPDVVFFGEPVPVVRTQAVEDAIAQSRGVLVVGSSLVVMSGYRIVRQAAAAGLPVVAVNKGRTRADDLLTFTVEGDCVDVLERLDLLLEAAAAP